MSVDIRDYPGYRAEEILPLYEAVGWRAYTRRPDMLEEAFRRSLCVLGAWEGERLAGILRAVGDGASLIFVQDLLVLPEYQRRGIGSGLLRELQRRYPRVYQTELMTDDDPEKAAFYASLGFAPAEEQGCRAWMRINRTIS